MAEKIENTGIRRNCLSQAISSFSTVFLKDLLGKHVKPRACLGKGQVEPNDKI